MTAPKKSAAKNADTEQVYANEFLTTSDRIDAVIEENPTAKTIQHWGGYIDVKTYQDGKNASK